jgi:ADP-ribose pyrophosphatase YjhB (NUDIX family)
MTIRNISVEILQGDVAGLPVMSGVIDEHTVRRACADEIANAARQGKTSVRLPAFGSAPGGFPLIGCAKILAQEILRAGREGRGSLTEIIICLDRPETVTLFEKQIFGYLEHVMRDLAWGPYVTTDIIIAINGGIVIIERTNPPFGWALPGGFVDSGESLEAAAAREAREETGLDLTDLKQFHVYSDPSRDPRFHTVSTVFTARGIGTPLAGDDAKGLKVVPLAELPSLQYAFDHGQVIRDYLRTMV